MKLTQLLIVFAMILSAAAPLLADTSPMSPRSVDVAVAGVILAVVVLLQALGVQADIGRFSESFIATMQGHTFQEIIAVFVKELLSQSAQRNQPSTQQAQT